MFLLPTSPEHLAEKAEPPPASGKCERTEPLAASPRAPSSAPGHGGPGRSGAQAAGRQWPCTARDGEPPGVPLKRCSPRVLTVCLVLAGSSSRWADEGTEAPPGRGAVIRQRGAAEQPLPYGHGGFPSRPVHRGCGCARCLRGRGRVPPHVPQLPDCVRAVTCAKGHPETARGSPFPLNLTFILQFGPSSETLLLGPAACPA